MEEWKDIPGYEGLYSISNTGNVLGLTYNKLRKFSRGKSSTRYYQVNLWKNNKGRTLSVHRLVMLAFKGESKLCVDHINGDILDNRIENLEYVTYKENNRRAIANGQVKSNVAAKPISQHSLEGELLNTYESAQDAYRKTGITWSGIGQCLIGAHKTSGGFIWKYIK